MRYSQSYLANELKRLQLDAEEIKQAQLTSQNSGMLGFSYEKSQTVTVQPAGGMTTRYLLKGTFLPALDKPFIIYPYLQFEANGQKATFQVGTYTVSQVLSVGGLNVDFTPPISRYDNTSFGGIIFATTTSPINLKLIVGCRASHMGSLTMEVQVNP